MNTLYNPSLKTTLNEKDIWRFYNNVFVEKELCNFSLEEKNALFHYQDGFGNMSIDSNYYRQHYTFPMYRAMKQIRKKFKKPKIIDLCCGTGMQSILFANFGGIVLGVDNSNLQLSTAKKRVKFYQKQFQKSLNISFKILDARYCDFADYGKFDIAYSHIGIDQLDSANGILGRLSKCVKRGGLVILKNGNPQALWHTLRGRKLKVESLSHYVVAAKQNDFKVVYKNGTTAFPRYFWRFGKLIHPFDRVLKDNIFFSMAFELCLEKF